MFTLAIEDNFLQKDYCNFLINYFEENENISKDYLTRKVLNLNNANIYGLKEIFNSYSRNYNSEIEWFEIVKWPKNSKHDYHKDLASSKTIHSSICYLNDDFLGGQTIFEKDFPIAPKTGRLLFFDGVNNSHGVEEIAQGTRYVVAAWYKRLGD